MDHLSPAARSNLMSRVRRKDTAPELAVRKVLHSMGYRFRLHRADLPGNPDLVLPRHHLAIFIQGCFWHGHVGCRRSALPKTNRRFWDRKIERNRQRDVEARARLEASGWRVHWLWECETRRVGA